MFCISCGKKNPSNAEFCTECGKKISAGGNAAQEGIEKLKEKSRRLRNSSIVYAVFIAALVAYGYYVFGYKHYASNSSEAMVAAVITVFGILFLTVVYLIVLLINIKAVIFNCKRLILYLIHRPIWGAVSLLILAGLVLLGIWSYHLIIPKSSSLAVTVFKGPVSEASVSIYELDANGGKGDLIKGPLTSDASGNVNFDLPANLPKRLFIESKGGFYKSEATGQQVQLKDADALTAVLGAGTKTAAVTPFTHMAAVLAQAKIQSGVAPDEAVISANEAIAKQYGLKSILDIAPVDATNSNTAQATFDQRQYGLLLAGFAQLAKNLDVRSIDLANAFAKDWSDGMLDGKENGNPITITNGPKLSSAGINGLNDATGQFAKSEKNYTSLRESSVSLNPVLEKIGLRIITTTLPSWVSGRQGSFTVTATGGSLPLIWSVKSGSLPEGFALSKDGIISGAYTLTGGVTKKIFPQFTLEVKDQQGQTQSVTLSITVTPEAPKITTANPPTLTVGQSYDEVIATASGGMPPYNFEREASSGPMPMGMQITSNGHLTGSPKAKGNFSFRVCVVDSASTEKCGSVAFAVKEKEVAAPTPAPTPPAPTPAPAPVSPEPTPPKAATSEPAYNISPQTLSCKRSVGTYDRGYPVEDTIRIAINVTGPVGAYTSSGAAGSYVSYYIQWDCGSWTQDPYNENDCTRKAGQPETTTVIFNMDPNGPAYLGRSDLSNGYVEFSMYFGGQDHEWTVPCTQ